MNTAFSHLGICVTDLERSTAFYCEGLGFERAERHEIGSEFAALMELDEVQVTSQFIRQGAVTIELLEFSIPDVAVAGRRPIAQTGLTHVSIKVDDLHGTAARLVELGGSIVPGTLTEMPFGDSSLSFVYLTDPDGTRVELMDLGG